MDLVAHARNRRFSPVFDLYTNTVQLSYHYEADINVVREYGEARGSGLDINSIMTQVV